MIRTVVRCMTSSELENPDESDDEDSSFRSGDGETMSMIEICYS